MSAVDAIRAINKWPDVFLKSKDGTGVMAERGAERIAEMLDLAPTDSALQVAGASIMTSLREGEVDRLMKIFENDTADFIDHTVRPQLIRAALLRHHSTVIADSSEARRKIHRAIEILRGDAHMEDVAESLQVDYQRDTLRPDAEVTEAVKERFGPEVTSDPTIPLLANLVEGEMLNQVLEDATGYRVIRLVERQGTALVVEWVGADRMGYEEWVEQEG